MKINIHSIAIVVLLSVLAFSCSKETTTDVALTNGIYNAPLCVGTMTFTVGTTNYSYSVTSMSNGGDINSLGFYGLNLIAADTTGVLTVSSSVNLVINDINVVSTGSYTIPANNNDLATSINFALNDSAFTAMSTGSAGTITITETSATTLQGTFSGTLAPEVNATSAIIIKNGKFSCTY